MVTPQLTMHRLDEGGVLVHGDRVSRLLTGALYERLVELLDGRWTVEAIVERLEDEHPPASVYYALARLQSLGFVVDTAIRRDLAVDLRVIDGVAADWMRDLEAVGVRCSRNADLTLVLTASYLDDRLAEINARALASGRPWVLCRPFGTILWFGPRFDPATTACWECLRQRLRRNLPIDAYLAQRSSLPGPQLPSAEMRRVAAGVLGTQLARMAGAREAARPESDLVKLDLITLETTRHPVSRRPQCARCGDPSLYGRRPGREIVFAPGTISVVADGGLRAVSPRETLARWSRLVDPLTGVVPALERIDEGSPGLHVYATGANLANPGESWRSLRRSLRSSSGGKGFTDDQARASAIGEAVERYSGLFEGDEPRVRTSLRALGDTGIHPNRCMLFSRRQLDAGDSADGGMWGLDRTPGPFDDAEPEDWTPVWSFTERRVKYLPTGLLFFRHRAEGITPKVIGDSNGNAAGNTVEEAILQGFFELVERDSTAIWWYNRLRRPAVRLDTLDAPEWPALRREYERLGREVWMLDLTGDLGVPVFAAVSRRTDPGPESIVLGLGAHLDARIAAVRALSEMNQMLVTIDAQGAESSAREGLGAWLSGARLAEHEYLAPSAQEARSLESFRTPLPGDLRDTVLWCQALVERHGMELLVLDQTRPDVELPVVKVIVPGLRHFRARFAPGRLYDVPVSLGWMRHPLPEDALNPTPFFL